MPSQASLSHVVFDSEEACYQTITDNQIEPGMYLNAETVGTSRRVDCIVHSAFNQIVEVDEENLVAVFHT
ncbi:MAG TPA: hypothetical protein VFC84_13895 [Desulfosporosinus sp.]|nr:hypothetical protein [Desulfosporosinus sp.]